jgi:phosphoribosylanthranilate isomerase
MKKLLLKVCGLREPDNIQAVSALGVDMLGFIFYPPSPRYVGKDGADFRPSMPGQKKTGVFVNDSAEKMAMIGQAFALDALQLHGQESPEICYELRDRFHIIKAFPIADEADFMKTKTYEGACDYFLFDTKGPRHGGNGFAFDWNILEAYTGDTPFLLSGGISPGDALKIRTIEHPKLAGLDLNSRFEVSPGLKNVEALRAFINLLIS